MSAKELFTALQSLMGSDKVTSDSRSLEDHSHDYCLLDLQRRVHGVVESLPHCVVKPESIDDVVKLMSFANERALPVVPFGAGSGVCAGAKPQAAAIVLDMRAMQDIVSLNETALTVTVQPGVMGMQLEKYLNARGFSMGHFPQSIELSTVGGWVSTRASGQYSSKYGSIENMLVSMKAVLADGTLISTKNAPRSACGPNVNEIFIGAEGSFAVLVELCFKIHRRPKQRSMCAFELRSMKDGLDVLRRIMQEGYKPALCRLYDALDAERHFPGCVSRGSSLLLVLCEGPHFVAEAECKGCAAIAVQAGARSIGEEPVRQWLGKRFYIPNLKELAEEKGVVFDTIEVSGNWDVLPRIYDEVIAALKQVPGLYMAYAHSSHSYQQGGCLYFSFAVKKPNWLGKQLAQKLTAKHLGRFNCKCTLAHVERSYRLAWQKVMETTLKNGGSISHHHGIGKLRMPWVAEELGSAYNVLKTIKNALDPKGILNPGTLFPATGGGAS